MKIILLQLFLLVFCIQNKNNLVNCEPQAPVAVQSSSATHTSTDAKNNVNTDNNNDRPDETSATSSSSAQGINNKDEKDSIDNSKEKDLEREEVIKILRSPEFNQEKEAQKLSMILYKFLQNEANEGLKVSVDPIDLIDLIEEEPKPVRTKEEIELDNLFEGAMKILNNVRGDKAAGHNMLMQAAMKGHEKSQAQIAWLRLLSKPVESSIESIKGIFTSLSSNGLPEANMVSLNLNILYIYLKKKKELQELHKYWC